MPRAQRYAEAAQNLGAQKLVVPYFRRVSKLARDALERENEFPHLRIGEDRRPPGMRLFSKPIDAVLLEFSHPSLDASWVVSEDLGYFITTPACTYQQQTVQPVHKARLRGKFAL